MIRVATDVGGTFTDLVYFEIDEKTKIAKKTSIAKSDTTPQIMKMEFLIVLQNQK